MTGNTIIIYDSEGNIVYVIKVRHSGYDIRDFLEGKAKQRFSNKTQTVVAHSPDFSKIPTDFLMEYLNWRLARQSDISMGSELPATRNREIFKCDFVTSKSGWDAFDEILEHAEKVMDGHPVFDDYVCSYQDYRLYIDWSKRQIFANWND